MKLYIIALLLTCSCLSLPLAQAQRPPGTGGAPGGGMPGTVNRQQGLDQLDVLIDTFEVFYLYADNPNLELPHADTTLGNYFRQYDPMRKRDYDYRNLGVLGSAHEPIVFEAADRQGFEVGLDQYELYFMRSEDFPYYRVEKPFSVFGYTLGSEQADSYTQARFARNFANGLSYNLHYDRITQFSRNSQYPNQNNRSTAFVNGIRYQGPDGRYDGFFNVAANSIETEDNGGVVVEPALDGDFSSPNAAEVLLGDARSRHAHREYTYTHYYRFGGGQDTTGRQQRAYTLGHRIAYQGSTYRFSDVYNPEQDSFYVRYPAFLPDVRGARFSLRHRKLENDFRLATFKLRTQGGRDALKQRDLIEVGAVHTLHLVDFDNADTTLNNLFLTGRYRLNPSDRLLVDLRARLGLLANAGDYRLGGQLFFDLKKAGQLELEGVNQLYSPSLMQHRLSISEQQVYRNAFNRTLSTTLRGRYRLPAFQFAAEARYHLLNNFIYFGADGLPQQTGVPVSVGQLIVEKNFRLMWNLHLDNLVALQQSSQDVLRLPTVFGKHSFYYDGRWFQVLDVRLGVDLRYNSAFFANYYNPATGQFQLQDTQEVAFYPAADVFFSMKVTKFRAFVKWENGTAAFTDDFFYQTALYPHPRAVVRIGIRWQFLN